MPGPDMLPPCRENTAFVDVAGFSFCGQTRAWSDTCGQTWRSGNHVQSRTSHTMLRATTKPIPCRTRHVATNKRQCFHANVANHLNRLEARECQDICAVRALVQPKMSFHMHYTLITVRPHTLIAWYRQPVFVKIRYTSCRLIVSKTLKRAHHRITAA